MNLQNNCIQSLPIFGSPLVTIFIIFKKKTTTTGRFMQHLRRRWYSGHLCHPFHSSGLSITDKQRHKLSPRVRITSYPHLKG